MSRLQRAMDALWGRDKEAAAERHEPPVSRQHSIRAVSPVAGARTVNRDQPIESSRAAPGARQQWQLHRAREESRDMYLRSPIWSGYVQFSRIQALGYEPARLVFDRLTRADKERLKEPIAYIRREWIPYQFLRGTAGTGRSIHQTAGNVLHHVDVDGDCFMLGRMVGGKRVWDLHPGDALQETTYTAGISGNGEPGRQLGIETDGYGKPIAYWFGTDGKLDRLNWGYLSHGSSVKPKRVPAAMVHHIRDRSGEVTAVRGWPRCTSVVEDIIRIDEWYGALVRSAELRASVGLALTKDATFTAADLRGDDTSPGYRSGGTFEGYIEGEGGDDEARLPRYQEFVTSAGTVMEIEDGFKVTDIGRGAPTAQEATAIGMLERRVCGALRTTPATLLGDYHALSFSGGQLGHLQEKQAVEDRQMILGHQFYTPVYSDFLMARWIRLMSMFPELTPDDLDILRWPTFRLRKYQVIDKARIIPNVLKAWEAGVLTYPEVREELGFAGANIDEVIEEWKQNRKALGLPETPSSGKPPMADGDSMPDDDPDKAEKDAEDEDE